MIRLLFFVLMLWSPFAWAGPVNVNTATIEQLDALPGIGPAKAKAIVDYRTANGPFSSVSSLTNVSGIGPATVKAIANVATVAPSTGQRASANRPPPPSTAPKGVPASAMTPPPPSSAPKGIPASAMGGGSVNINAAGVQTLTQLPGIGPSKAQTIVDDRKANGPFSSCGDLVRVKGVGPATINAIGAQCKTR